MSRMPLAATAGVVGALALATTGGAAATSAKRSPTCSKAKGTTLAKASGLRVYRLHRAQGAHDLGDTFTLFACKVGRRTLKKLAVVDTTETVGSTWASARIGSRRYVAADEKSELFETSSTDHELIVYDVSKRKRLGRILVSNEGFQDGAIGRTLAGYRATSHGGLAALENVSQLDPQDDTIENKLPMELRVRDAAGSRLAAKAASITDLKVTGQTVSWSEDGQPRSLTLSGAAKR